MIALLYAYLWQGALFAAAAAVISRCISVHNAATRCALWYVTLLAAAALPPASAYLHVPLAILPPAGAPAHATFTYWLVPLDAAAAHSNAPLVTCSIVAWAAGALFNLARLVVSYARIKRVRDGATPLAAAPGVLISDRLSIPIAAGFRSPVVIVPAALCDALSAEELRYIIEHERAHIARGDVPANLLVRFIQAMLFFNPWIHIAARNTAKEREAACDDLAVYRCANAPEYAAALAESAKFIGRSAEPLLAPGAFGSPHAVVFRIRRVLERRAPIQIKLNYYAIGGTTMLFIIAALALQSLSPVMASTPSLAVNDSVPALVAAAGKTCTTPNSDVTVTDPATPAFPKSANVHGPVQASARVTVARDGSVVNAKIARSSGNAAIDRAALAAAESSKYSPKIVDCKTVQSTYLFLVRFSP